MRISSYTDLILSKLHRIKQIEENKGQTIISEGIDANYMDIVNYAIFALIKLSEEKWMNRHCERSEAIYWIEKIASCLAMTLKIKKTIWI